MKNSIMKFELSMWPTAFNINLNMKPKVVRRQLLI